MTVVLWIVVADRHAGFRQALCDILAAEAALSVLAVADLRAAGDEIRRRRADALVVDVSLLEAERHRLGPVPAGLHVVVVGMDDAPARRRQALAGGAHAYVVKDRAHTELAPVLLDRARS
jgi:DNA-binding NarL/FixJ family response regulator